MPLFMSLGTVKLKSSSQPQSCRSSSWKWIAAYWCGARRQSRSAPVQAEPFMARVGRLTSLPCSLLGPVSSISIESMRREKSQAAKPWIRGASILPLKQRRAGRSVAASAPIITGAAACRDRLDALPAASPSSSVPKARASGCWPTRSVPVSGSALAQTRYQMRARSFLPTTMRSPPASSAIPSGVRTSAKPAPVAGSRRERTVCGPSSGSVGQISASTCSAAGSFRSFAASTRP